MSSQKDRWIEKLRSSIRSVAGQWAVEIWVVTLVISVAMTLLGGFLIWGRDAGDAPSTTESVEDTQQETQFWTCSMHPTIKRNGPGQCPLCGMDLIPVTGGVDDDQSAPVLRMSPRAVKLAEIRTAPVERKMVTAEIRMVGKVDYDETRLAYITSWFPGRLDRLYVDYTGVTVRKGDHLVYIYSPEVRTAQTELLEAARAASVLEKSHVASETGLANLESARVKLRLWGLTPEQISEIEERGTPSDHITIYAPIGGIVIHKNALEGMYVKTGTRIFTIADLKHVWVKLDAYESDMMWIRYGQDVEFRTEAYPGQVFHGQIAFIDPVLNKETRTVKVRVNVDNRGMRLKPEMFVRAVVRAQVAGAGMVIDPALAGKWICPMHPDVLSDGPAECDQCGMDLVESSELGYKAAADVEPALVIPVSAPLITGTRAVVYVKRPEPGKAVFEGREVVLGPRAGDHYLVESGLTEGEEVVTRGNFKIDSALQIEARPSMMSPEGGVPPPGHDHGTGTRKAPQVAKEKPPRPAKTHTVPLEAEGQLSAIVDGYLEYHSSLYASDSSEVSKAAKAIQAALSTAEATHFHGEVGEAWKRVSKGLNAALESIKAAEGLDGQRTVLPDLTLSIQDLFSSFDWKEKPDLYRLHCPMAFGAGKGADWLQADEEVRNPFYGEGAPMQRCGTVEERLAAGKGE